MLTALMVGGVAFVGTPGPDQITGTEEVQAICVGKGDETIRGGDGDDRISGSDPGERVIGGTGEDRIVLKGGNDRFVDGEFGSLPFEDLVRGGSGSHTLSSGNGETTTFGAGTDVYGGSGADHFIVLDDDFSPSIIFDYNPDEDTLSILGNPAIEGTPQQAEYEDSFTVNDLPRNDGSIVTGPISFPDEDVEVVILRDVPADQVTLSFVYEDAPRV
ncbi:MAG: calcium-binding protein [Shimia sp.]